jgi:hypothetical protein
MPRSIQPGRWSISDCLASGHHRQSCNSPAGSDEHAVADALSGGADTVSTGSTASARSRPSRALSDAVLLQAKLVKNSTLKVYPEYPHGMLSVHAEVINPDLLAFIKG